MDNHIIEKAISPELIAKLFYVGKDNKIRKTKYPWHQFEVGDSMFFPAEEKKDRVANKLMSVVRKWARYVDYENDWKTQQVDGGVRIWRIK